MIEVITLMRILLLLKRSLNKIYQNSDLVCFLYPKCYHQSKIRDAKLNDKSSTNRYAFVPRTKKMSTQDIRKLSTVIRSIELIEEKTNILHSQYTTAVNENENHQAIPMDDSNVHLQLFFQNLEQLLQVDLKNRSFLLNNNNKRNYWNFFSLALKDSKGLYDTISYVLNSQDVKTSTGRGRLFLRFCLQTHRLGDVIQQSFMTTKIVNQFYIDDCFWTTPTYMNRVIQALYQLSDLQFDLLDNTQCQLDLSWPTIEITEPHPRTLSNDPSRMRNESSSSILSMTSVDSQSIVSVIADTSNSIPIPSTIFANLGSSINDGSSAHSLSSVDEDPENTVSYWKEKYLQLEIQSMNSIVPSNDVEIQCSLDEEEKTENPEEAIEKELLINENEQLKNDVHLSNEKNEQLQSEINVLNEKNEELNTQMNSLNEKNEQLKTEVNVLKEEMNNLNFQLSSISMQRSTTADKIRDYERDLAQYQKSIENKDALFNELQMKYDELKKNQLKAIDDKHLAQLNERNRRIEILQIEMEKISKLLENERKSMEKERKELNKANEQLEAALQEKTLDFEEMKRRLVKAVREKAELFNTIHTYEMKLQEQQSKKWVADEEVDNCTKCNVAFGWTVRRHHCRDCQKIFCNHCSSNWIQSPKANTPQYRVCDFCHDNLFKGPSTPRDVARNAILNNNGTSDDVDIRFEVRPERLQPTTDTQ